MLCLALPALVAALVLAPAPQRALADAEDVLLASRNASGEQGNDDSHNSDISADGRFVAFHSRATNLVPGVTSGTNHVFRKDLQTGEVALVSCDAEGVEADAWSGSPSISADGRYVAFQSMATDLVSPATTAQQVFRKDLDTGKVALVSSNKDGEEGDLSSGGPSISASGEFVAFESRSHNLVSTPFTGQQVLRKNLETGGVVLCSANASGEPAESNAPAPSISADGRFVAFYSSATNLVPGGTFDWEVFRKDLKTKEIALVSSDALGDEGNATSSSPAMTPDGRFVSFQSYATNLVSPATGDQQVFRKELLAPTTFYFAEGYTGAGFQEYLCLGQPVNAPLDVVVTFMFPDGTTQEESYAVPALSRLTVDVNAVVGAGREVSVKCQAEYPFIAERPMYFDYASAGGHWTGGHDVVGASSTSLSWYFAEGYTGPGFDEWICVLNPGGETADLTFVFQTQEEGEKVVKGHSVPARSRASFLVNDMLGGGTYSTSLKLESSLPVVAERPMYFSYSGIAASGWTGGHCVVGAPSLATLYYFAEGTTRTGFEEWLTLQNPGGSGITVKATYMMKTGEVKNVDYPVPASKRSTIYVPDEVGAGQDVSVRLACDSPFLAERPMYFDYSGIAASGWTGGHCVIGATRTAESWFFAEGYTGPGFEEWLCIQNPGATDAQVTIVYYPEGGGTPIVKDQPTVAANSRYTVYVNWDAGENLPISAEVMSSKPVIVERPMYFDFRGLTGGHDVVGFIP